MICLICHQQFEVCDCLDFPERLEAVKQNPFLLIHPEKLIKYEQNAKRIKKQQEEQQTHQE